MQSYVMAWEEQVEQQKKLARETWKIDYDEKIPGPKSMPKSVAEKFIGKDAVEVITRKTENHAARKVDNYQCNTWNDPQSVQDRVIDRLDELISIDPRYAGVAARPDYRILRQGIPQPAFHRRKLLGLPRAFDSDVFREAIEVVCLSFMEGIVRRFDGDEAALKVACWKTRLPSMRGKGLGFNDATDGLYPNLATGQAANLGMQKVIFPKMLEHPDGAFAFMDKDYALSYGWRNQVSGFKIDDDGYLWNKHRVAYVHIPGGSEFVVPNLQWEPSDGEFGMRARTITMVPTPKNLPLVIINTIFMFNLTQTLKRIFKRTPMEVQEDTIGHLCLCTDFSQFEFTQEDEVRLFAQTLLYSDKGVKLARSIDSADMWTTYVDDWTDHTGEDARIVWSHVPRSTDDDLRQKFSMLSSGTGDTALLGKVLGLATAVTYLSHAISKRPAEIMGYPGNDNCIAADVIRNLGDDCKYITTGLLKHGYTMAECEQVHVALVDAIDKHRYFDLTVESVNGDGGVFTGLRDYNFDGKDPRDPKSRVQYCHLDDMKLYMNNLMKENSIGSGIRNVETEHLGLYGSISTYITTFADSGRVMEYQRDHVERLLELSGFPGSFDTLADKAEEEAKMLMEYEIDMEEVERIISKDFDDMTRDEQVLLNMAKQWNIHKLMEYYRLKNPDEINWKLEIHEIEAVVGEIGLSLLFLLVPKELTTDGTKFINVNTFHLVARHLRGEKYVAF